MGDAPWEKIEAQLSAVHDYSTSAEAVRDTAVAAFNYAAEKCGLTGFQGSWAALSFYGEVMHIDGPYTVFKAEDMLYPQYDLPTRLAEWMNDPDTQEWLIKEAATKLAEKADHAAPRVIDHWKKLTTAVPPAPVSHSLECEGCGCTKERCDAFPPPAIKCCPDCKHVAPAPVSKDGE